MKSLKNYINESILDTKNNNQNSNNKSALEDIKEFIAYNYKDINIERCKIIFDKEKDKYVVNCIVVKQDVILNTNAKCLTNGAFKWGEVKGNFTCANCEKLTSLEGAPEKVMGWFDCSYCEKLTSLKGAPKYVGGTFSCKGCPITTTEGAPERVGRDFSCTECSELISLQGSPEFVGGHVNCTRCSKLSSLNGIGEVLGHIWSDMN